MKKCNGRILHQGGQWYCLGCGMVSSSWRVDHKPLRSKVAHILDSLLILLGQR